MAQATCLFRDDRHVCGEPAVGQVPIGHVHVPVCGRHYEQLRQTALSAQPQIAAEPATVPPDESSGSEPVPEATTTQVSATDAAGSAEHT